MDHLACFMPAMLALGVHRGAVKGEKADKYLEIAADVTYTCWQMYEQQPTGAPSKSHLRWKLLWVFLFL